MEPPSRRWSVQPAADGVHYRGCCVVGDYIGPPGRGTTSPGVSMAEPIARDAIDVYFVRATTSRGASSKCR